MPLTQSWVLRAVQDPQITERSVRILCATPEIPDEDGNFPESIFVKLWATPGDSKRSKLVFGILKQIKSGDLLSVQGDIRASSYGLMIDQDEDPPALKAISVDEDIESDEEFEQLKEDNQLRMVTTLELYVLWVNGKIEKIEVPEGGRGGGRGRRGSSRSSNGRSSGGRGRRDTSEEEDTAGEAEDEGADDEEEAPKQSSSRRRQTTSSRRSQKSKAEDEDVDEEDQE